jgi:hypothetical protein
MMDSPLDWRSSSARLPVPVGAGFLAQQNSHLLRSQRSVKVAACFAHSACSHTSRRSSIAAFAAPIVFTFGVGNFLPA